MRKTLLILSFALLPMHAFAQIPIAPPGAAGTTDSVDDLRKNAKIHAGPFYVDPAILLKELGVDTNVFNESDNPRQDFTFTLTPQANVSVPIAHRALVRTIVGTDIVYYQKYSTERSLDPFATVRTEFYARKLTLFAQDTYLNTRQRPNYEIDVRSRHLENDLTAGLTFDFTARTAVEFSALRGRVRFDGDVIFLGTSLAQTLNRDSTGQSLGIKHKLTSLTTVAVKFERLEERFPLQPVRDTNSFRVMPGVEFKPRALIKGFAYVGYRSFNPIGPLLPDYHGLVSQLGLSYTLLGATTFGVTYDRDITFSFEQATPYFLDNSLGLFIRRAIGGKWDVMATAARHKYDYTAVAVQSAEPLNARVDRTDNYGASLGYGLKRDTRIGFGVSYYTRGSTEATFRDYNGLRVGTTVTYGF